MKASPKTFNIPRNSTIIIGFSGGPDSLYLLLQLKDRKQSHNLTLIAAHLDHEWRPESAQELLWCKQLCQKLSIDFISQKASNIFIKKPYNGSKEEQARYIRRYFFENIAQQYNNAYIALAHHKDDQIETFFIRLARGASLQGLTGIKENDGLYVRPLLHISKQEILQYLADNQQSYVQDKTNQDSTFLRNRIRNNLTPMLATIDSRLLPNVITTMTHLSSVEDFLQQTTLATISKIALPHDQTSLDTQAFLNLHPILQQRIILSLLIQAKATFIPSQSLFAEIIRFLQSQKHQEHTIHPTYKIIKVKKSFSIVFTKSY